MSELEIEYSMSREDYWLRRGEFLSNNPSASLPILVIEEDGQKLGPIIGYYPIVEFLHEKFDKFYLMPDNFILLSEIRKYIFWFNDKFFREVTKVIVDEKVIRPLTRSGEPRSDYLRAAKNNLNHHFKILENILENNSYLVSDKVTLADIVAASHVSIVDYFGEIQWDLWPLIKHWYSILKSRPAFRLVLADRIPGLNPPSYYLDPDF